MMPAAKMTDPVLGVDVHIIQPPGPVPPVPVPHPFIGMLFDPMDLVPIIGATIFVNGMPRAIAGTSGKGLPPHIPIGGVFVKPPSNECEMFMGSATVALDGDAASYMALPALSCNDIGMPPPPRTNPKKKTKMKSLALPSSVVLPIPAGLPVLIGGPPTISLMALGMKALMTGLGKLLKKPKKLLKRKLKKLKKKALKKMKPGFIKCKVLRAEPVHILTGEVMVEQRDFALGWRIPLDWTRQYGSQRQRVGLLGRGWETPADARLEFDADGSVSFQDGGVGGAVFPSWPSDGPVAELVAGAVLDVSEDGQGAVVRAKGGLRWYFRMPVTGEHEVPVSHVVDGCGNWLQFLRDRQGNLSEIRDSSGQRIVARMQNGLLAGLALVDPETEKLLPLVRYEYDNRGDLAAVYDALNVPYRFGYDWQRRLERHTDRVGLSFHYEYDEPTTFARCVHAWGDGGLYDYRFEYLPAAGQVRITDSLGHTSVVEQDEFGMPIRETDPLGGVTTWEYDDAGRCSAEVDAAGRRTEWEYDEAGSLVALVRPDGSSLSAKYDDEHRVMALTDPAGGTMAFEYDRGRLAARTSPRGGRWSYRYDGSGDLVETTDPVGAWQRFEYDHLGRLVGATQSSGPELRVERDGRGNIVARTSGSSTRTAYRYDAKNRLVEARYADGRRIACGYDGADNLTSYHEGDNLMEFRYSGLGMVVERTDGTGGRVRYAYDSEERVVAVGNERGELSRFVRDPLGRVQRELDYWGQQREYSYDSAGRLASTTDPLGQTVEMEYDELDRMIRRTLPDGVSETFSHDLSGNVVRADGVGCWVERTYDADGNLLEELSDTTSVSSSYDLAGRRVGRSTSSGNVLGITYGPGGQLDELALNGRPLLRPEYDESGAAIGERLGELLHRSFEHDGSGRLTRQTVRRGSSAIAEQSFRYDGSGQLAQRLDLTGELTAFDYDPAGRVRQMAMGGAIVQELSYDEAGDLARPFATTLEQGEFRAAMLGMVTWYYDRAGRAVRRSGPDGEARFTWDALDRLTGCVNELGQQIEFAYDPLGRRIAKRVDGSTTRFAWDGDTLLGEVSEDDHREFIFRPETFTPLAVVNGSVEFYETDNVGLPHLILAEDGTRNWEGQYDALSRLIGENDGYQPLRLQGQYADVETGLVYNRYRYFEPLTGAFISQDPLRQRAGANLYSYGPSVWNWIDVFGLDCKTVTVYRVEGPGNARVHIDADGGVKIPNKDDYLYVSFRDQAHADYFLKKKRAEFPDSTIKAFDVPEDVVNSIQDKAVPQRLGRSFPGAPQISDPTVAKKLGMSEKDVLGVKGDDISALEAAAIPGSGRVL